MNSFAQKIVDNYYWIFVLLGLFSFLTLPDVYSYVILLTVFAALVGWNSVSTKWTIQDGLVVLFVVYQLISVAFSNYPLSVWYYGVKGQVMPIVFYFIGRSNLFRGNTMMNRMWLPIFIAMVVGLILYFWEPSWYISRRLESVAADASEASIHERTRLSSFWPWSYTMGYASLFFLMYYAQDFFQDKISRRAATGLVVAVLVLFFAQQRVTIAYFFVFMALLVLVGGQRQHSKRLLYLLGGIAVTAVGIYYYLIHYADSSLVEYILNRSVDSDDNIIVQRFEMFERLLHISLLGEGLGKYGHAAYGAGMNAVTDCDYIRFLSELGILGTALFFCVYVRALLRAYKYRKAYFFEFNILFFNLFAMIGASPFENLSMQHFLIWYCMGRVYNRSLLTSTPPQWLVDFVNRLCQRLLRKELTLCAA